MHAGAPFEFSLPGEHLHETRLHFARRPAARNFPCALDDRPRSGCRPAARPTARRPPRPAPAARSLPRQLPDPDFAHVPAPCARGDQNRGRNGPESCHGVRKASSRRRAARGEARSSAGRSLRGADVVVGGPVVGIGTSLIPGRRAQHPTARTASTSMPMAPALARAVGVALPARPLPRPRLHPSADSWFPSRGRGSARTHRDALSVAAGDLPARQA